MENLATDSAASQPLSETQSALATKVAGLNARYRHHSATAVMQGALQDAGHIALVSSFGAESVVLLHMAAVIDPMVPVLFVDTELLFTETLVYQQEVSERLGLRNVQIIKSAEIAAKDPYGALRFSDTDACCALRKTAPLQHALGNIHLTLSLGVRRSPAVVNCNATSVMDGIASQEICHDSL